MKYLRYNSYSTPSLIHIKTHGSESRGQEGTKHTPNQKMRPLLWVIYVHDGTVLQFSKILHHILKSAWRNLRLTKIHPSYHRHKTFVLVLYTTRSFRTVCAVACWSSWRHPHTIMSFLKPGFRFHFFSSSSQLIWQPYSYQRACTTKILILLWDFGSMYCTFSTHTKFWKYQQIILVLQVLETTNTIGKLLTV